MEVRGIGIIDVRSMYGVGAVKLTKVLDLVVEMEPWDDSKSYDRLGLTNETIEILGVKTPKITLPVKPGRNLAALLEVAARNHRLKSLGYNSAEELDKRIV
jgi:HPr kinase/phosphorylase